MPDPKGSKLYVNLSAAQTRKRLKGFGHGVRKIQSAGKNRAVVIHTARGIHKEELMNQFHDVGASDSLDRLSEPVGNLRNLGPTSAAWLREVGIRTVEDLVNYGPAAAFQRVRQRRPEVSLNLLWAMAAGLQSRDWRELTASEKARLRVEVD